MSAMIRGTMKTICRRTPSWPWLLPFILVPLLWAEGNTTTLAVIPGAGPRAPDPALLATLEVALSREEGTTLVERTRIARILEEQRLGASGLADPAARLKLGRIIGADAMLVLEKIPGSPASHALQVVETRTALILVGDLLVEDPSADLTAQVLARFRLAMTKLAAKPEDRRHVSFLGLRNEEPGSTLDGRAEALGLLARLDLAAMPAVFLLDREHLDSLAAEQDLAGVVLDLKKSALLLDGSLRRAPEGGGLVASLRVQDCAGRKLDGLELVLPEDAAGQRTALAGALAARLRTALPSAAPVSAEREAALLRLRARALSLHGGESLPAVQAAEAALALFPCPEQRKAFAEIAFECAMRLKRDATRDAAQRPSFLRAATRRAETGAEVVRDQLAAYRRGEVVPPRLPVDGQSLAPAWEPATDEERGLLDLLRRGEAVLARERLAYVAARWNDGAAFRRDWLDAHLCRVERERDAAEDADGFTSLFKDGLAQAADPPLPGPLPQAEAALFRQETYGFVTVSLREWAKRFDRPENRERTAELHRWIQDRPSPLPRLALHVFRCRGDARASASRAALELFAAELPPTHPERAGGREGWYVYDIGEMLLVLGKTDPDRAARLFTAIYGPILDEADPKRILAWEYLVRGGLDLLETQGRGGEAGDLAERTKAVLATDRHPRNSGAYGQLLEVLGRKAAKRETAPAGAPDPWSTYAFTPLAADPPPGCDALEFVLEDAGDLVLVWSGKGGRSVCASAMPATGGPARLLGEAATPGVRLACAAAGAAGVFVGTRPDGLLVIRNGKSEAWGPDRLPGPEVSALAVLGGKLYAAFGGGGFDDGSALAVCDPGTGAFTVLASSRSAQERNPLDGGNPYMIHAMLADAKRGRLWFTIQVNNDFARSGLWSFSPEDRRIAKVKDLTGQPMAWCGGRLLVGFLGASLLRVDPDTLDAVPLIGHGSRFPFHPAMTGAWPAVVIGDDVLAAGGSLDLYTAGAGNYPLKLRAAPDGRPLSEVTVIQEWPGGILVGTRKGLLWSVKPVAPGKP